MIMGSYHPAAAWAEQFLHDPVHIDCTTSVMLKILDGKCKMNADEKAVIAIMYDVVWQRPGKLLQEDMHKLIAEARRNTDPGVLELVYEKRVLAETMISRPVMKAFKAMLRGNNLIS
jgi:hypothetical protein